MGLVRDERGEALNAGEHPLDDDIEIRQPDPARLHSISQEQGFLVPPSEAPQVHLLSADTIPESPILPAIDSHNIDQDVVTAPARSAPGAHWVNIDPFPASRRRGERWSYTGEEDLVMESPSPFGATGQRRVSVDSHVAAHHPDAVHGILEDDPFTEPENPQAAVQWNRLVNQPSHDGMPSKDY